MKRNLAGMLIFASAVLAVVVALPVSAQDPGAQATIVVLQTEVSTLQTQLDEIRTPITDEVPIEQSSASFLFGEIDSLVPAGNPGKVEVVSVGAPVRSSLPIVIRNNSDTDVLLEDVLVTGRDASGGLVTVSEVSSVAPYYLPSGGIAVGDAYFGTTDIPSGLTFEFEIETSETNSDFTYRQDLQIQEATNNGSELVGIAANSTEEDLTGPFRVTGVCFDSTGQVNGYFATYATKDALSPGETTPFSATFYGTGPCDAFAVGITGYKGI